MKRQDIFTVFGPYVLYSMVALLILWPLLSPGFVLTLDMVFTPRLPMPETVTSSYVFRAILHYLSLVIPADVIQKCMLFAILLLSGLGTYRLMRRLQLRGVSAGYAIAAAYVSGLLYMVNPFTYSRFMAGQYSVLLGYACVPFFARALIEFIAVPSLKRAVMVMIWMVVVSIVSIHTLGILVVLTVIILLSAVWYYRRRSDHLKRLAQYSLGVLAAFIIASSYWLVPLVQGQGATATSIETFQVTDQSAFATNGDGVVGKLLHVLRLQGFWGESHDMYVLPQDVSQLWPVFVLIVWVVIIIGIVTVWRRRRSAGVVLLAITTIAVLLSTGVGMAIVMKYVPFFAGYREPQKFVALIALCYAIAIGYAVPAILTRVTSRIGRFSVGVVLVVTLVGLTPVMFKGFDGQLASVQYPVDWYSVNNTLRQDTSSYKVLSLPWHLYMRYDFAGRIIANPSDQFFDASLIVSDDPELDNTAPAMFDAVKHDLTTRILPNAPASRTLGRTLAPLDIKYVLLSKDIDADMYSYLDHQTDLKLVSDSKTLKLYRNTAYRELRDE